jgi:hypothetical protein
MKNAFLPLLLLIIIFNSCKKSTPAPPLVGTFIGTTTRDDSITAPDTIVITTGTANGGTFYSGIFGCYTSYAGLSSYMNVTSPAGVIVWNAATDSVMSIPALFVVKSNIDASVNGSLSGKTLTLNQKFYLYDGINYAYVWTDVFVGTKQ